MPLKNRPHPLRFLQNPPNLLRTRNRISIRTIEPLMQKNNRRQLIFPEILPQPFPLIQRNIRIGPVKVSLLIRNSVTPITAIENHKMKPAEIKRIKSRIPPSNPFEKLPFPQRMQTMIPQNRMTRPAKTPKLTHNHLQILQLLLLRIRRIDQISKIHNKIDLQIVETIDTGSKFPLRLTIKAIPPARFFSKMRIRKKPNFHRRFFCHLFRISLFHLRFPVHLFFESPSLLKASLEAADLQLLRLKK